MGGIQVLWAKEGGIIFMPQCQAFLINIFKRLSSFKNKFGI